MVFTVEFSLYKNKEKNVMFYNRNRREQAENYNCNMQYFIHEIDGYRHNIKNNDCIHIVIFDANNYENLINYLTEIKKERISYIECVYKDNVVCDIMYCSPRYLKRLDKNTAKTIKNNLKNIIDEQQKKIHSIIKNL
tara:strand:+ start:10886 stop:11296 length:411 start_codon:yes stop_codon:yes gene_type:complete